MWIALLASMSAVTFLVGCAEDAPAEDPEANVWSEQTQTLDRAESVEQTLDEAAQRRREALDAAED